MVPTTRACSSLWQAGLEKGNSKSVSHANIFGFDVPCVDPLSLLRDFGLCGVYICDVESRYAMEVGVDTTTTIHPNLQNVDLVFSWWEENGKMNASSKAPNTRFALSNSIIFKGYFVVCVLWASMINKRKERGVD